MHRIGEIMKETLAAFVLILLLAGAGTAADQTLGPERYTSAEDLALAINAYFPKVQGAVTAVDGDRLTLGLGKKDGLMPGMELTVWRDGKEILHPVTKAVLGRTEDEVGTVEVVAVGDKSSTAAMKKRLLDPKAGDRARITPKKINIAVLPVGSGHPEIIRGLTERLGELGRFTVLGSDKVSAFLKDRKDRDVSVVRDMGKSFGLDAVVAVDVFPTEGKFLVTSRIFYADETKPLDTIVALLDLSSKREALGEVRPFFAPVAVGASAAVTESKERLVKMPNLPQSARFFAAADLDGDGRLEYVFSNQMQLTVYRIESSEWKKVWTEQVPGREAGMQQFYIDIADINKNGRPEIFVTRMLNGTVSSYVIESQEGGFRRIADVPGFLRVIDYPGKGKILIGQDYDAVKFYGGSPREYAWSGGTYVPGAALPLPEGMTLYSFIFADFGEGRPFLVSSDNDDRLVVSSGDTRIWKSEEQYFNSEAVVLKPVTGLDAVFGRTDQLTTLQKAGGALPAIDPKDLRVRVPGRMIAADMNGDGKDDIVVPKNTPDFMVSGYKVGGFKGGELQVLQLEGKETLAVAGLVPVSGGLLKKNTSRLEVFSGK
jgi:hypothetical protein